MRLFSRVRSSRHSFSKNKTQSESPPNPPPPPDFFKKKMGEAVFTETVTAVSIISKISATFSEFHKRNDVTMRLDFASIFT